MVDRDGAAPPSTCRSMPVIEMRVLANQMVDLIGIQHAIVISLVQDVVAAVDAPQLHIICESHAAPAVCFRKDCVTQATDGVCSDVSASVKRLVVAQICGGLPICFSARGSHAVTGAILGATSMTDFSCHELHVFAAGFEAMQLTPLSQHLENKNSALACSVAAL